MVRDSSAGCSGEEFKAAMRRIASTVNVLTTEQDGRRWGLTATAVCSLCAEPPMVLACINRTAEAYPVLMASMRVAINVLDEGQADVASRFSGSGGERGEQKFAAGTWTTLATGAPVLADAALVLDCVVDRVIDCETHAIFICRVEATMLHEQRAPLVYLDRQFMAATPLSKAP